MNARNPDERDPVTPALLRLLRNFARGRETGELVLTLHAGHYHAFKATDCGKIEDNDRVR